MKTSLLCVGAWGILVNFVIQEGIVATELT